MSSKSLPTSRVQRRLASTVASSIETQIKTFEEGPRNLGRNYASCKDIHDLSGPTHLESMESGISCQPLEQLSFSMVNFLIPE